MKFSIVHKFSASAVFLVLLSISMVGWVFYSKTSELLVTEALNDIAININNTASRVQQHIEIQKKDLLFLAQIPPIQGILRAQNKQKYDSLDKSTREQWVSRLQILFSNMLSSKREYLSIRFFDKSGIEQVVVKRINEKIIIVPADKLQNKYHRNYVNNALTLKEGLVYISKINLNREYGKVSLPHHEVVRTSTPIYHEVSGKIAGLISITSEIGHELRTIQDIIQNIGNTIYITNDRGGYLLHPDRHKAFGFDLGKHYRIQEEFPQLAKFYLPGNKDATATLLPKDIRDDRVIYFSKIYIEPSKPERFIAVGLTERYSDIVAKQTGVLNNIIIVTFFLTGFAVLIAIFLSYRLSRPIKQITQVMDDYSHHRESTAVMPSNMNDEIGQLASSYESMMHEVEEAHANLKEANSNLENRIHERTAELEVSEMRQRLIVENIVDGLLTINDKGIIESINPAAMKIFGYDEDEVIGQNIKILMPEPYHSEHDGYLENYNNTGDKKIIGIGREVEGKRKDGSIFPLDLSVAELQVNDKKLFTGLVRDITERKQMDKMKNEFISTVSHELRTPLTSIRGSLGLLSSGTVGELPESANEMLKIASNNTERLLLLINDILDIQKIESGKMSFNFHRLELKPFLEQAVSEHAEYGNQHGVTFVITNTVENAQVYADRGRLMQVMANLLSNAAKFSHAGENVEISVAEHHEDRLRISVTDYGVGISEDFHEELFERFTQSDSSDTRSKGGTGLGLSISKVIMEKHGGEINFVSKEGIGSIFYIDLPRLVGKAIPADYVANALPNEHLPCVLIVEDDPDVAALIRRMLAEAGFNSDVAYDAAHARKLLADKRNCYRLMTLDIVLPDEDGLSLLKSLRKDTETQNLPVVVLSVKADEAKRELNGGAIGVDDWLSKPIDQERLTNVVKRISITNHKPRVLHVEDEEDVHRVVKEMLKTQCELIWTKTMKDSREALKQGNIDLVLLDIGLPDGSGLDLLEDIELHVSPPHVVIFSAQDVPKEYSDRVYAVLVKSKTNNKDLLDILINAMS